MRKLLMNPAKIFEEVTVSRLSCKIV